MKFFGVKHIEDVAGMYNYARVMYCLANFLRHAYWDRDKLLAYRDKKTRAVVKYAYEHSRFYHDSFKKLGLRPDDIRNVKDLNKLPIFRRSELQKNIDNIISDEFDREKLEVDKTSGSSGQPLFVYLSKKESEFRKAKMLRANVSCGQRIRDRWLVITAPSHLSRGNLFQRIFGFFYPFSISVFEDTTQQLSIIRDFRPDVIEGYSSVLFLMAKELEKSGIDVPNARLIIGGADFIDEPSREFVERMFSAPFFDQYASVELEAMAWQCVEKGGYHIDADSVVMQFVDEEGEEVAPGERGEIVCTSLFNYAMPFIRYAIGDIGVFSDDECSCGRVFPVMKMIEGRKDSFMRFSNGRILSPRSFTITMSMFSQYDRIDRFRIIQKSNNVVEVVLKLKEGVKDEESLASSLEAHMRKMLKFEDSTVDILVRFTDDIALSRGGKLNAVVSYCKSSE